MSKSKDNDGGGYQGGEWNEELSLVEAEIIKDYGKIFMSGQNLVDRKSTIISVSPKLDIALSGGIPGGSFVILTGPPKVGKSSLALKFASNAQKEEYNTPKGPRKIYYFDVEARIKPRDVRINDFALSSDKFQIIHSTEDKILYAHDYLSIAERIINYTHGSIVIFDSLSALCSEARKQADIKDRFRDDTPLMLASFCKRIANILPITDCVFVGITHLIANQGQGHSLWLEASGRKVQYQADVKLKATHFTDWKSGSGENATIIGQDVHWECDTSALGPPGIKVTSKLRYGYGVDSTTELVELCADTNIIGFKKPWYTINGEKLQGLEKAVNYVRNNRELERELYGKLRSLI